jgi:hypothetical protein
MTPLHVAAGQGQSAMVAALLTHGADVNAKDNVGCGGLSPFRATVGMRRAAVADRDGTDAMQMCMHTKTDTRFHVE